MTLPYLNTRNLQNDQLLMGTGGTMDFHSSIFILLDFVPKDFAEVFCLSFDTDTWFRWTSD